MVTSIGYAWIQAELHAPNFLGSQQARPGPVPTLQRLPEGALLVPVRMAPSANFLQQALFAIKHEGVRLPYLIAALRQVSEGDMRAAFMAAPNGSFVRKLCFLWEAAHQRQMTGLDKTGISATYVQMFDPKTSTAWVIWLFAPSFARPPSCKSGLTEMSWPMPLSLPSPLTKTCSSER